LARHDRIVRIAALVAAAVFVVGAAQLMVFRFRTGDIYPPYSSLRADPLGAKAFHDSLAELNELSVARNYRSTDRLKTGPGTTMLVLGLKEPWYMSVTPTTTSAPAPVTTAPVTTMPVATMPAGRDPVAPLAALARGGARLVITFHPRATRKGMAWFLARLGSEMGFSLSCREDARLHRVGGVPVQSADGAANLEPMLQWHSPLYLSGLAAAWRTVYLRGDMPVVAERRFGAGSVVIATDSYFLSNEAMHVARAPRVLAWLIGGERVVFDETHLGAREDPGVATLARQYNLAGVFFVLVGVAGLFVWKNAVSFMPRDRAQAERLSGASVEGRGSSAALMNLLRRTVPPSELLGACLAEWDRSGGLGRPDPAGRRVRIEGVVNEQKRMPRKHRDLVAAYRCIYRILTERR